jgi:hypothetical protein
MAVVVAGDVVEAVVVITPVGVAVVAFAAGAAQAPMREVNASIVTRKTTSADCDRFIFISSLFSLFANSALTLPNHKDHIIAVI